MADKIIVDDKVKLLEERYESTISCPICDFKFEYALQGFVDSTGVPQFSRILVFCVKCKIQYG